MVAASYKVYIDFTGDGDFSDAREDVTGRVLDGQAPLTMRYGRDQSRVLSPISPAEAHFVLDNSDEVLSPENTASPLYDLVVPGREVQVTAVLAGTTYPLLRAQLDDFKLNPDSPARTIDVDCIDPLGALRGVKVSTGVYRGLRPGEAAGILLDAVGWPAALRDLETGATVMPFWWLDNDDAYEALMDLVASEGPPALATVDTARKVVFRGRHHRLQNAASTAAQSTWRSTGASPRISPPAAYNHGWKEIVNSISFQVPQLALSPDAVEVWSSQGQQSIASGDTLLVVAQGTTPFTDAITPEADTDFTLVSGTVSVALTRTSGASVTILVTAVGGPAVIADLALRGRAVVTVSTLQVSAEDAGSVRRSSLPDGREPKWASLGDATAICQIILGQRSQRLPTISVSLGPGGDTAELTQQLTRDLSDRVHVDESHSGLDADCFIEQISHSITQGGLEHSTTFGLEKCATQVTGVFILGSATAGVLGTNKLGKRGLTQPSMMFVIGTQGVLGTNVLVA